MLDLRNSVVLLVTFTSLLLALLFIKLTWKRRRLPPGPFALPVLGNVLQIHKQGVVPYLVKMGETYGPVCTIFMGSRPTVILTGYQAVKEALVDLGDDFLGRGPLPVLERVFRKGGLALLNGTAWKQLRQFTMMTFRDFGMGKKTLEEPIQVEAQHLVKHFRSYKQEPVDPSNIMICASSNIIASILMGTRYNYSDDKWMQLLKNIHEAFVIACSTWGQLYDMVPNIMQVLPGPHNKIFTLLQDLVIVVEERVKYNLDTLEPNCPRDFIDCYLIRMKQEKDPKTPFTVTNLVATVTDTFLGGAESTGSTVNYGLLIFIKYPEIQAKLQEEIQQVIGHNREPVVEDRNNMSYLNAFIHELQRYCDVFPMGANRSTTRDLDYRGYYIPKGTDVLPVLTTVLKDPTHFETPGEFNINHFLDENGTFKKNNGFLAFSAGKRSCAGESLVRMQLFIFFATILQKFTLKATVDPKDLDLSPAESGIETIPPVHKIIFIPRE
ncbi:cytochrome P450 2G1 [Bombina bombina]|uniref:cytochrome P450 2G1 n=1 Tax=Bombina bombina TaxID=8345 RepID=UPI00235A74D4|nr:cytochrome P450 2G1 [Bombina bombina]